MSNIDYDMHYPKHCVRYYGWLPASQEFKRLIRKRTLKFLTLCAKQAIDVFMLELEGIISRDHNGKLPDVIICEKEPKDATEIFRLVRPPLKEAILIGGFEKILTFQETEETVGLSPDEDVKDYKIRRLLRIKRLSERAREYFPFDLINFDTTGNLLSPPRENNKLFQSLNKIFELQKKINTFLLFITTPIYDIHSDTESCIRNDFESNVSTYGDISTALQSSFGTTAYDEIDERKRIALGFAKSVVISAAKREEWNHKHWGIFVYESPNKKKMLNSVVQFYQADTSPDESSYIEDVVRIIEHMPEYYSWEDSLENQEVKDHLERVKRYRENIRNEYRET